MNYEQVIRKAVELAKGWELYESQGYVQPSVHGLLMFRLDFGGETKWRQITLDALAAQLVRQVDATDCSFTSDQWTTAKVWDENSLRIGKGNDYGDRTMNTMLAIVESSVLEADND